MRQTINDTHFAATILALLNKDVKLILYNLIIDWKTVTFNNSVNYS